MSKRDLYRQLYGLALRLRDHVVSREDAKNLVFSKARELEIKANLEDPLLNKKIIETFERAWESERTHFDLNEMGNEERFVAQHRGDIRFCHGMKTWYIWDGKRWAIDETELIKEKAKETVRSMREEVERLEAGDYKDALRGHWNRSAKNAPLNNMAKLAQSRAKVAVKPGAFDSEKCKWLLNCKNGTIDLRTSELLPHNRKDLITKAVPVEYDPSARCPEWSRFLTKVTGGDIDLERFLQRIVGYALTGETLEKCLFLFLGPTDSGKTTFIETIREMLGPEDYARATDFQTFVYGTATKTIRNDIARLQAARFVSACEAKQDEKFDEVLIKQVTGRDTIMARYLYKEYTEWRPQFKVFLAANQKPRVMVGDDAFWNRIHVVPFAVRIPKNEQDRNLGERFKKELPGILAWTVKGCLQWQKLRGLKPPKAVIDAVQRYRMEADVVWAFTKECCYTNIKSSSEAFGPLWQEWVEWCSDNEEPHGTQKSFAQVLEAKGFEGYRTRIDGKQHRMRRGLVLKSTFDKGLADAEWKSYKEVTGRRRKTEDV